MSTAVAICSNALLELGLPPINTFDDGSDRALAAANLWPDVRDSVLRSHPWNCAVKRVILSPDATAPAFGYAYGYTRPSDDLRVLSITQYPCDETPAYEVEGRQILTDEGVVYLRYVWRNDNPETYDATLTRAMTLAMAAALAIPACEDASKKQAMEGELMALMRTARAVDGMEAPPEGIASFPLLAARR